MIADEKDAMKIMQALPSNSEPNTERVRHPDTIDAFWAEFDRLAAASADEDDFLLDEAFSRTNSSRCVLDFEKEQA